MADLADQIDDYICSFEGVGDLTMDTLAMLIFAWAVIALFVLWLCKFLYNKYVKKVKTDTVVVTPDAKKVTPSVGAPVTDLVDKTRRSEPKEILSSRDVRESSAKPLGRGVVRGGAKGGASGYVPPTPPMRKRLSRKSPGPELRRPSRVIQPPSNVVGPETISVTWTSQVFRWLYSDLVIVNELLHTWVQTINESMTKSLEEHGVAVEIVRVLPESPPPQLTNIFCAADEKRQNDVTITMDCECTPVLQVKAFRQKSGKVETSHYKATVSRFRGRLTIKMDYYKLLGEMRCEGYPDIRIGLNSIGAIKGSTDDETHLQEVVAEILIGAIRNTIYPVDFSIYSTCPRPLEPEPIEVPLNYPIHYDSLAGNMEHLNDARAQMIAANGVMSSGRRLLVKVLKGDGLAVAKDPFCVVEMDEPPQKNQTGVRQGANPVWDEHFLFDLSSLSAEILFEVYDRATTNADGQSKFLGLGLVGIDELAVGPASSQILTLQPRPYESEAVSGAITVEFVFIEGAEIPTGRRPYKLKNALKIDTHSPSFTDTANQNGNEGDIVGTAIKALEGGALHNNGHPNRSTLIIHSVQRVGLNEKGQIELDESALTTQSAPVDDTVMPKDNEEETVTPVSDNGDLENSCATAATAEVQSNGHNSPEDLPGEPISHSSPHTINGFNGNASREGNGIQTSVTPNDPQLLLDDDRGRSKKKRDFFGTLKRRLGRSKSRAKSVERDMIPIDAENPRGEIRSISADRGVSIVNNNSTLSSAESSAISGISSASTKTYVHEASTLVLETIENGVKRHFLVPLSIAQRPRWRRKGTKLHIYNDHTFVAKHLSGGLLCDVCNRSIPRRPGKQGYECRDCQTKCHKQCHVRTPQACTNPTVLSIELSKLNSAAADRSIRKL
uniref:Protein kinase c conserved region 1 n=1 Tax=Nyssomyia neivai TaxID=330878 RepID=A0A1L8DNA7_9DIPT